MSETTGAPEDPDTAGAIEDATDAAKADILAAIDNPDQGAEEPAEDEAAAEEPADQEG
ncbi:MAG: hypothetical protein ACRDKY_06170 [Solirubrobacteraceae bacterium]